MQTIHCTYHGARENAMLIKTQYIISCPHISLELVPKTPLILTGDFLSPTVFEVSDVSFDTTDDTALEDFFTRRSFKGIGKSKVKLLIRTLKYAAADKNYPDFSHLKYEEVLENLKNLHIPVDTIEKIALLLTGLTARTNLYHQIKAYGGSLLDADKLYQKFQGAAMSTLYQHPYLGTECGLSLLLCDRIARQQGFGACYPDRIMAIGTLFEQYVTSSGSCCISLDKTLSLLNRLQSTKVFPDISSVTILNCLEAYHKVIFSSDTSYGILIYPNSTFKIEQGIARELARLSQSPELIGFWKYSGDWTPDPEQMRAIRLVCTTGVKIITGGPGTGKTSVIHEIIREYKKHSGNSSVFLCAPTGAAAARINQSVNGEYHALTIHKLLDVRCFGKDDYHYTYNRMHQLPMGLYILDEMSMVSEELFYHFLLAVPEGSTMILTGDVDQLQSISSGTVLQDLIDAKVFETVKLTTVHRQNEQSLILTNCQHIKNGDGFVEAGKDFTVDLLERAEDRLNKIAEYYLSYNGICQILTCTRTGMLGKIILDDLITQAKTQGKPQYKNTGYYLGDKVMMIRNNYQVGYFNGDCGLITKIEDQQISVQFYDGLLTLTDDEIADMEHAWACTVHKSQGNEYDNVIIVLDPEYPGMLYRSLLFTAVSRAKHNVHIVSSTAGFIKALNDTTEDKRITGLKDIIRTVLGKM